MNLTQLKNRYYMWVILLVYVIALFFQSQLATQKRAYSEIGVPRYAFGDGVYYAMLTENLVKRHTFVIYDTVDQVRGTLKASGFSLGANGKIYINFLPLFSVLMVPAYLLGGIPAEYLFNALLGVLTCYFVYRTCRLFTSEESSIDTTLIFAFGTIILTYSQVIYAEVLTALLTVSAFYFAARYGKDKKDLVYSGLLSGALILAKPTLIIIPASILVYHFVRKRFEGLLSLALPMAFFAALFFAYNLTVTGNILQTTYSNEIIVYDNFKTTINHGDLRLWQNNPLKTIPVILILLLATQPVLLVSIVGIIKNYRRQEVLYIALLSAILLSIYSLRFNPIGFWCWSARLLTPIIPLLAVPFALAYEKSQVGRNVIMTLTVISIALTVFSLAPVSWHLFTQFPLSEWIYIELP